MFSSYAKQLEQGLRLLAEAKNSRETARTQHSPRSFARITDEKLRLMITDYEVGMSAYDLTWTTWGSFGVLGLCLCWSWVVWVWGLGN